MQIRAKKDGRASEGAVTALRSRGLSTCQQIRLIFLQHLHAASTAADFARARRQEEIP